MRRRPRKHSENKKQRVSKDRIEKSRFQILVRIQQVGQASDSKSSGRNGALDKTMCFRTNKFPEQASDLVLVQRMNQILGIEKERLYIGLYVRGDSYRMPGGEDE